MSDQVEFNREEAIEAVLALEPQAEHEERTLEMVVRALTEEKHLLLAYTDAKGQTTMRVVDPRAVKRSKAGDLLMVVYDLSKNDWRSFRSDRIHAMRTVAP